MKQLLFTFVALTMVTLSAFAEGGVSRIPFADPYILLDNGIYYAYGTHSSNGIECYTSTDLRIWESRGLALNKSNTTETQWFWAPEVYKFEDKYYMYYSANEHLFVATASSPLGPFKQEGTYQMNSLLGSEKCIDSSCFTDEDGTQYLFFVRFNDGNCIWMCKLADDHITPVEGTLVKCFAVSAAWEQIKGRVCEGPNVIKKDGYYFLTYSANDYTSQDYAVGYARTKNIKSGPWGKYARNPILRRYDGLVGTGHHSLFYDKDGKLRIVFHAHNSTTAVHDRLMYIGTMSLENGVLSMTDEPLIRPTLASMPYNPDVIDPSWGYSRGGATAVDMNNDGYLDIIAGGQGRNDMNDATDANTRRRQMDIRLFNPTTTKWDALDGKACAIQVASSPAMVAADFNHDGIMDIAAFETVGETVTAEAYTGDYGKEGVFIGNGDGTFTTATVTIKGDDEFDMKGISAADVADIDNDGRPDIIGVGQQGEKSYNIILHNISETNDALTFEVVPFLTDMKLSNAIVEAYDFNNDGFCDFIISAKVDGSSTQQCLTDIFLNSADTPGTFTKLGLDDADGNVKHKYYGALQVADFNNDGHLDFFLAGNGDNASGERAFKQRIYINDGQPTPNFTASDENIENQTIRSMNSVNNAAGVIDWTGDGNYDIIANGLGSSSASTGMLYIGDGTGKMTTDYVMPSTAYQTIVLTDWDGNGVKDFLTLGTSTDVTYLTEAQRGKVGIVFLNQNVASERPSAPENCKATEDGKYVVLSWEAPKGSMGNETFDFYIKDSEGHLITSTPAHIGGDNDGVRKVCRMGSAGCNTSVRFKPSANGTYYWGVQTVNAAYDGSVFSEEQSFSFNGADTAIHELTNDRHGAKETFNALGQRIDKNAKGIVITRTEDGKISKSIAK